MATKKRASSRTRLLNRAVKAGRSYLRQAERRIPPDVRKQIDRSIKDGQKTVEGALKQLRTRLDRTARQVDLDKVLKRLDGLTKQMQELARSASSRAAATTSTPRRASRPATRKTARKAATAPNTAGTSKAAESKAAAPRKASARRAAPRRRSAAAVEETPSTVESPSMAIPDPSPREPADETTD